MANKNQYIIDVKAQGTEKAQNKLKGLNSSLGKMTKAVGLVSAAYFGAKGLISGAMGAVDAFGRQEEAEKKLRFAAGSSTQALLNQASALQEVTTFGDEAIISQQAFLSSLEFTQDQIESIIPVALDLSEATGISLESAVRNTAKTYSGLAGELGELIPQLRDLTTEQMKAGDAVKVMGELFAGQAQAGAKTFSGEIKQLSNIMGDLAEFAGQRLIETFGFLVPILKDGALALKEFIKPDDLETFAGLNEKLKDLNDELKDEILLTENSRQGRDSKVDAIKAEIAVIEAEIEARRAAFEAADDQQAKVENMFAKNKEIYSNLNTIVDDHFNRQTEGFKKVETSVMKEMTVRQRLANWYKSNQEEETKLAALSGKSVIRNEIMEGTAGLISSILKSVPYPFNIGLAAASGIAVQRIVDKNLASFEDGGMVGGRRHSQGGTIIEAEQGEFVMSRDAVSRIGISNLEAMNSGGGGMTINISAPLVDDTVVDSIIPKIKEAVRRGESLT